MMAFNGPLPSNTNGTLVPSGPPVSEAQLFSTSATITPKNKVPMAKYCPRVRAKITPITRPLPQARPTAASSATPGGSPASSASADP